MKKYHIPFLALIVANLTYMQILFADRYDEVNKYYLDAYNLYRVGKTEQSLELLKKVIEIDPNHAEAYFGMGSIYFRQNMLNEAVREFNNVIRIKPEYAQAYERLWLAYRKLGMNNEAEEALQNYRQAITARMQAVTGEIPQAAKPVTQPSEEKPKAGEPQSQENRVVTKQEENKADQSTATTNTPKAHESQPQKTKIEAYREKIAKQSATTTETKISKSKPLTKETQKSEPSIVKPAVSQKEKPQKQEIKGSEPSAQPSKVKSGILFKNPFKKYLEILNKSYIGKIVKSFLYYIAIVQIWLCVVTSVFIYFLKIRL